MNTHEIDQVLLLLLLLLFCITFCFAVFSPQETFCYTTQINYTEKLKQRDSAKLYAAEFNYTVINGRTKTVKHNGLEGMISFQHTTQTRPVLHKKQRETQLWKATVSVSYLCLCVVVRQYCVLTLPQTEFVNSYFVIKFYTKIESSSVFGIERVFKLQWNTNRKCKCEAPNLDSSPTIVNVVHL